MNRLLRTAILGSLVVSLAACGGRERPQADLAASQVTTIGVNSYLWRASLDTLSFMPLLQTDSNGGVIVTDWYVNPNTPTERMKVTVTILDQDLRADALRVAASGFPPRCRRQRCRSSRTSSSPALATCGVPRSSTDGKLTSWRRASMR